MTRRRLYNPAHLTSQELKASFLARHDTLNEMLRVMQEQGDNRPCQHMLLIGPRGMGKTTLGLRFLCALGETPGLAKKWQPVPFFEESYTIGDLADFWIAALHHLARATNDSQWAKQADALLDEEQDVRRLSAYARSALMDYCRLSGKRLVLFVENLDILFDQLHDETEIHALRASLMERSEIVLVGSANTVFGGIRSHGEPFYEFFRLFILRGLTTKETSQLLFALTESGGNDNIPHALRLGHGRLETIRRLTGGNPRLLVLACQMLNESPLGEAFEVLERLIDEQTPYFKARIEELPRQARRVFHCLAEGWHPMLAREVAHKAKLDSSHASAQLRQLEARGYIRSLRNAANRKIRYEVADRFYNMYFLLRFSRGGRRRLERLIFFLQDLFGREAMRMVYRVTLTALNDSQLPAKEASEWLSVLSGFVAEDENFEERENWRHSAIELAKRIVGPESEVVREIYNIGWIQRGHTLYELEDFEGAVMAYRKATLDSPKNPESWTGLGKSLAKIQEFAEAIAALGRVPALVDPSESAEARYIAILALATQADALLKLNRPKDAVVAFGKVEEYVSVDDPVQLREGVMSTALMRGLTLSDLGKEGHAISVWNRSIKYADCGDVPRLRRAAALTLWNSGLASWKIGAYDKAVVAWRQVCSYIRPEESEHEREVVVNALNDCSQRLMECQRGEEALWFQRKIRKYVSGRDSGKLRGAAVAAISAGGFFLQEQKRNHEAIELWSKIDDLSQSRDPSEMRHAFAAAIGGMGHALAKVGREQEAMRAWKAVADCVNREDPLESRKLIARGLATEGEALIQATKFAEAEAVCRNATRVAEEGGEGWHYLAVAILLSGDADRLGEAEVCARVAARRSPDDPATRHVLSDILACRGQWEEALVWLGSAMRLGKGDLQKGEWGGLIDSLISAVAANQGSKVRYMMEEIGLSEVMEPLWYAIRADLGEELEPLPVEIADSVTDILEELSERRG